MCALLQFVAALTVPLTGALVLGLGLVVLMIPLSIWIGALGVQTLRGLRASIAKIPKLHFALLPVSLLLIGYGFFALHAAHESARHGGGLFGAFGLIPIGVGSLVTILSVLSLFLIRTIKKGPTPSSN